MEEGSKDGYEELEDKPTEHSSYPTLICPYQDPVTNQELLLVVVALPGASKNTAITVDPEGTVLTVTYDWPVFAYEPMQLFATKIEEKKMTSNDPMIGAINAAITKFRKRVDDVPKGSIRIKLPFKVETSSSSIKICGTKKLDGTLIVIAKLIGLKTSYQMTTTAVKFDF